MGDATPPTARTHANAERLSAPQRRASLLDVALDILVHDGEPAVTVGSVAARAGVTRALVYKHFENRDDLVIHLYRREAERLTTEITQLVAAAPSGFESKFRAMVLGMLDSADRLGTIFNPLRHTAAGPIGRREQRVRNRQTLEYYAHLATHDFELGDADASTAIRILLGGIDSLMSMIRPDTSADEKHRLADLYVGMTVDALRGLAA
jgi:AcrR family transcriptional regulator